VTSLLFRDDAYLLEFDARVVARREHEGRPAVLLDRTAFYAESGGQPWDTGTLGSVTVVAVVEQAGEILHVLGAPLAEDAVRGRVDGARRRDHREQHHGQHLLSRAFAETASALTVSFHLGADVSSIDLDREMDDASVAAAEQRANQIVWEARPVSVRVVSRAEAEALGVHAPNDAGDSVRLVEAQGFDLQPCGGTHPRNTAEVGVVLVLGHERYKGGSRVRFVCGHRGLEAFRSRAFVLERLSALLSAPIEALPDAAQRLLEQAATNQRRTRELLERALDGEARRLLAATSERPALIVASYDGWPPDELRGLATRLMTLAPGVALLASRTGAKAHLVFAQSEGLGHDVPSLLREAAAMLGGRGGGKGALAQGGGDRVERVDAALAQAAARVRATGLGG
jgi:alanyl-tRNA synthetase